jgi:hypothetical protein
VTELREVLQELVAHHGIAGALVGVLEDGRVEAEAAGIPNLNSGVEMTPAALFLTGSITKVWVTTLRPRIPRIRNSCDDTAQQLTPRWKSCSASPVPVSATASCAAP